MSTKEDEFLNALRATFKVEAAEHVQAITTGLLALEKTPAPEAQRDLIATVFRAAHNLKGAARAVDFTEIESLCQSLEDLFASWKREERAPAPATFDPAHRALDAIAGALCATKPPRVKPASTAKTVEVQPSRPAEAVRPLRHEQEAMPIAPARAVAAPADVDASPHAPMAEQKIFSSEETVRITVAKLDARLVEAEEMLTAKLITSQRVEDLRELARPFEAWRNEWAAVEPDARTLRQAVDRPAPGHPPSPGLTRLLEFFDQNLDHFKALESSVAALTRTAEQDRLAIGKLVDDLLEDSKNLLLLPSATLVASFPKLVRDLCRDLGKEADLIVHGEEVEIDKRILEQMKDPLIHLLRNCVDHGIEAPEQRIRLGKPACGTITLTVSRLSGSKVEILVADDGAGIDTEKVKASAVKHGFLSADDARRMGDTEARALIFQAEVSTSPMITRLSGRGLGLAIVREQTEKLGGTVSVENQPGQGTRFRLLLPSLLAAFRGVLIEVAGRMFVVPTAHVECVARVRPGDIQTVEGRETIALSGRAVALVWLADVLALPRAEATETPSAATPILVLGLGEQRVAFAVDAILDEQEVLVKPLRKPLSRVRNIAGATVLGSGRVAPILNVADLLKSARKSGGAARVAAVAKPVEAGAKSLLVVEDSITSRMLLKGILESAGYNVKTAVDGLEAFTLLRAERFDLVVSDVEMPRLNGFDLTARIRADKKLSELPIVLVTALEKREDRERGIDVGANAYLVKSSFDQSNLLDAVQRLV
jgi:two-component system chemotaxis sensor kinase CheA